MRISKSTLTYGLFLSILIGCSTTQKQESFESDIYPPDISQWQNVDSLYTQKNFSELDSFYNKLAAENPNSPTTWWAEYRRAQLWEKKDKNVSCESYVRLAQINEFPLQKISYLQAHALCPQDNKVLERLEPFHTANFEPWLSSKATDVAILKARQIKDNKMLVELLTKKSKFNLRKDEKIELTDEALKLARQNNLLKETKDLEKRLYNLSPSKNPKYTWRDHLNIASDYRFYREFEKSRAYYKKVLANKRTLASEKLSAFRAIRNTYRLELNRPLALKTTEELVQFVETHRRKNKKNTFTDSDMMDAYLLLARTYWTDNKKTEATKTLSRAEKTLKNKTSMAELYWMRGRMFEEAQEFKKATDFYDLAIKENKSTPAFLDKVRWYRAWSLRKQKDFEAAKTELLGLRDKTENPFDKARFSFWYAKTLNDLKLEDDAKKEFENIIDADPLSYYSYLAHREIGRPINAKTALRGPASTPIKHRDIPRSLNAHLNPAYVEWLIAVNENLIARDYLESALRHYKKTKDNDAQVWQTFFHYYARTGSYQHLFTHLYSLDTDTRKELIKNNIHFVFPQPYFDIVQTASLKFDISSDFIYSIMRQESSFNPQARSHMDAFGLMQLLPQVAERTAKENNLSYRNAEDLYEPAINIPLGAAHLKELWTKYKGDMVLATASYNASEKAIETWLKTRYRGDTIEFIEDIPYDETRDYVKLVLRNMLTYQSLNANNSKLDFPEWTLKITQASE
jgi:soluble lytic murein transglycosylase